MKSNTKPKPEHDFAKQVARAMKRAARAARKVAKLHGTPIAIMRKGKVVALKP